MTANSPFPPELRTAGVVPRWSIVWTLTQDTVATHSFFVTFYSYHIARLIMWNGDHSVLMYRALTDDLEETITGDLPSPVKREILDDRRAASYVDQQMTDRLGAVAQMRRIHEHDPKICNEADRIIKAADRLDALLFLTTERRLGNGVIAPSLPKALELFETAWFNLPADPDKLSLLWNTRVAAAVQEHNERGGWGL